MELTGLKYGMLTAVGLILYFLLMSLLGLLNVVELRFLNGLILAVGVVLAIRNYKQRVHGEIHYFKGLGTGVITAVAGTVLFAVFVLVYVKIGGEGLLNTLSAEDYLGERVETTPGLAIFTVLMLEGLISGFMIAFIAMQFFKRRERKAT
ncbi:uncharacterized protein DUF4199 [Pontibacter ummariensis]|uniref:DUF4199 domain-containing protein n=1 Tax=Pontibacter ummariensis TaxID=1610492 RepID=A0A239FUX2_9BACT|nr:DUF4199 domain-containing protein [Pontibacter ummariensis]PRY11924.1 uncharacterized protein DUF4199 [Pontibacter ummariensis]SNS60338.1 Protein of unknown function [Pontibacter ummariensis]